MRKKLQNSKHNRTPLRERFLYLLIHGTESRRTVLTIYLHRTSFLTKQFAVFSDFLQQEYFHNQKKRFPVWKKTRVWEKHNINWL